MMQIKGRLARLEQRLPADDDLWTLTYDEVAVLLLDEARKNAADESFAPDVRAASAEVAAGVEAEIRWQAALANHPTYAAALERLGELIAGFVPAIAGYIGSANGSSEVADLEKPQVMERRAVLRSRPDIRDLIEAGGRENPVVEFGGQFVAAAIRDWRPKWQL